MSGGLLRSRREVALNRTRGCRLCTRRRQGEQAPCPTFGVQDRSGPVLREQVSADLKVSRTALW